MGSVQVVRLMRSQVKGGLRTVKECVIVLGLWALAALGRWPPYGKCSTPLFATFYEQEVLPVVSSSVEHDELALHLLGLHEGNPVCAQQRGAEHDVLVADEGGAGLAQLGEEALRSGREHE